MNKGDILVCKVCGMKIEFLEDGEGPIVCCGQDMEPAS